MTSEDQGGYKTDPELVALVHKLQQKILDKDNEVLSQQLLMNQLMEQQKEFQKRNKKLTQRLKATKRFEIKEKEVDCTIEGEETNNISEVCQLQKHATQPLISTFSFICRLSHIWGSDMINLNI